MTSGNRFLFYITGFSICIILFLFMWISFDEWYTVRIEAEEAVIDTYKFGQQFTINQKGWHYKSAELYSKMNFLQGISLLFIFIITIIGIIRRSYLWLPFSICLLIFNFFFWKWYLA